MMVEKRTALHDARRSREILLAVLTEVLAEVKFLDGLECEALSTAERYGPIRERIQCRQRIWSHALDQIEPSRQDYLTKSRAS